MHADRFARLPISIGDRLLAADDRSLRVTLRREQAHIAVLIELGRGGEKLGRDEGLLLVAGTDELGIGLSDQTGAMS